MSSFSKCFAVQNVFRPWRKNAEPPFSNSSDFKSIFEWLRFRSDQFLFWNRYVITAETIQEQLIISWLTELSRNIGHPPPPFSAPQKENKMARNVPFPAICFCFNLVWLSFEPSIWHCGWKRKRFFKFSYIKIPITLSLSSDFSKSVLGLKIAIRQTKLKLNLLCVSV